MILDISSKIGAIGDLHMGKNPEERWDEVYDELLEWIIDSYLGKVDTIFFLGDVFDGHYKGNMTNKREKGISFRIMAYVNQFFERLAEHFHCVVYAGNHCCYYKDRCDISALTLLKGKKNITVVEETTSFQVGNRSYKIVPWACPIVDDPNDVEPVDAVFGHFDIKTFNLNNFKKSEHGYSTKELFEYCDTVYTGHYHMRQEREYQKGAKKIFYMGSPLQLGWGEADKESFIYIIDLEKNEMVEEFRNDISPKHVKIPVSKILKDNKVDQKNIVAVQWDIPKVEDDLTKVHQILETSKTFSSKFNFDQLQKNTDQEFLETASHIDPEEILAEYIQSMDLDIGDKLLAKCVEYVNMAT